MMMMMIITDTDDNTLIYQTAVCTVCTISVSLAERLPLTIQSTFHQLSHLPGTDWRVLYYIYAQIVTIDVINYKSTHIIVFVHTTNDNHHDTVHKPLHRSCSHPMLQREEIAER